jgi:uncharacterized membrane protein YeaQ/YmgE (transglycosylase-associated protein family)
MSLLTFTFIAVALFWLALIPLNYILSRILVSKPPSVAPAFTAAALVAGAAIFAYLVAPANPPASVPVPLHGISVLGWILLGLIAGFIASKIVNRTGQGFLLDIVLGIVGAVVGGFLFSTIGATGITGFNLYSMFVAIVGATVLLWVYHAMAGHQ